MTNLTPRPLPGAYRVPRALFMALLAADFDALERHGGPLSVSKFWMRVDGAT